MRWDGRLGSALQRQNVRARGDNQLDASVERFGCDAVEEILESCSRAGGEDGEVHGQEDNGSVHERHEFFSTKSTKGTKRLEMGERPPATDQLTVLIVARAPRPWFLNNDMREAPMPPTKRAARIAGAVGK